MLIIGSGFTTHGLPYLTDRTPTPSHPAGRPNSTTGRTVASTAATSNRSSTSGAGARNAVRTPDDRALLPAVRLLGASGDPEQPAGQPIDGFWMGLAKRSLVLN